MNILVDAQLLQRLARLLRSGATMPFILWTYRPETEQQTQT